MRLLWAPSGGHEQAACLGLELPSLEKAQEPAEPFNPKWETVAQEQEEAREVKASSHKGGGREAGKRDRATSWQVMSAAYSLDFTQFLSFLHGLSCSRVPSCLLCRVALSECHSLDSGLSPLPGSHT